MLSTTCSGGSKEPDHAVTVDATGSLAEPELQDLASRLGYSFRDLSLLQRALTHRSWCAEHPGTPSNERLEFLGDAVLGWVVADVVFDRYRDLPEGKLTDLRKAVVNATALAQIARRLGLGDLVRLGRGESSGGGADKDSILSDALEAVLGAIYLDAGPEATRAIVASLMDSALEDWAHRLEQLDPKTRLQELVARLGLATVSYEIDGEGPDHDRWFQARVMLEGEVWGTGEGRSMKRAEQAAAAEACSRLEARVDARTS